MANQGRGCMIISAIAALLLYMAVVIGSVEGRRPVFILVVAGVALLSVVLWWGHPHEWPVKSFFLSYVIALVAGSVSPHLFAVLVLLVLGYLAVALLGHIWPFETNVPVPWPIVLIVLVVAGLLLAYGLGD